MESAALTDMKRSSISLYGYRTINRERRKRRGGRELDDTESEHLHRDHF